MIKKKHYFLFAFSLMMTSIVYADISVPLYFTKEKGLSQLVGTVRVTQTKYGLLFTPDLKGLVPGIRGFHIHKSPSCAKSGMAAGGHLDPQNTKKHLGPYNDDGHFGDLPALYVASDGTVTLPVLAPRILQLSDIQNHTLMVHHGGDNYSDTPKELGGGDGRMACGIINGIK